MHPVCVCVSVSAATVNTSCISALSYVRNDAENYVVFTQLKII